MKHANVIYFGSPDFSAEILESILAAKNVAVVAVVTTPDKPTGRKQLLTPSPVAIVAARHSLPVYKPAKLDEANLAHLKLLKPDIFLVVSYGKIIPATYLSTPSIGTFNLHFSLLPRYRGALPISEAIKNEDHETGVTLMVMDEALDHGPLIAQQKVSLDIDDNVADLTKKLTQAGIKLLRDHLPRLAANDFVAVPQDESAATYTPFTKTRNHASAFIDWGSLASALEGENASAVHALIRSNNPDPGSWTKIGDTEVKIIKTRLAADRLVIETVQLPGKSPISWKNFLAGHPLP